LQTRYQILLAHHCGQAQAHASGPRILPDPAAAFAATQAAWRFYQNPKTNPKRLAQPLRDAAATLVPACCQDYVLSIHDWSDLDYRSHSKKTDRMVLGQKEEIGYELHSCLLLDDVTGSPLAPVYQAIKSADGLTSSRHVRTNPWPDTRTNLDALLGTMNYVRRLKLGKPAVHIIDSEADSVFHLRAWHKAGHLFVVRVEGNRRIRHQSQSKLLHEVHAQLRAEKAFTPNEEVLYKGRKAFQFVAQTEVVLYRPARRGRKAEGKRRDIKGPPLSLRLVVSEVRDADGQVLATWLLLTNLPAKVTAGEVALWYYWRWRTESYFKLLKAGGQQLEHWQQETAKAVTKRLLVAAMACVLVWQVSRAQSSEGRELRELVGRLSGRTRKYGREWTLPALLAGTWVLLASLQLLEEYSVERLRELAQAGLPLNRVFGQEARQLRDRKRKHNIPP
jgi:hypothetical protein